MKRGDISISSFGETVKNLTYDTDLQLYKQELFNDINSNNLVVLNNQFFYITDLQSFTNFFVHKNLKLVLGYDPGYFKSMENIYKSIHPEDHDFVLAFTKKIIDHSRMICLNPELVKDPYKISFSIDFRVQKSDGKFIRLNRVTSCVKLDRQNNLVFTISQFTDIDHLKKSNNITWSCNGDDLGLFSAEDLKKEYLSSNFSNREMEILNYLSEGVTGNEIAYRLNISEHTVISHRKNMLEKAQARNTAELVRFAQTKGIL